MICLCTACVRCFGDFMWLFVGGGWALCVGVLAWLLRTC